MAIVLDADNVIAETDFFAGPAGGVTFEADTLVEVAAGAEILYGVSASSGGSAFTGEIVSCEGGGLTWEMVAEHTAGFAVRGALFKAVAPAGLAVSTTLSVVITCDGIFNVSGAAASYLPDNPLELNAGPEEFSETGGADQTYIDSITTTEAALICMVVAFRNTEDHTATTPSVLDAEISTAFGNGCGLLRRIEAAAGTYDLEGELVGSDTDEIVLITAAFNETAPSGGGAYRTLLGAGA